LKIGERAGALKAMKEDNGLTDKAKDKLRDE
jgi:hypothetical protein